MTVYQDEIEVRRPAVSTKVLVLACAILAVLGSFWGIVWFIRAYVEPPRVMMPAPMTLASQESRPVPAPPAIPKVSLIPAAEAQASDAPVVEAQAAPAIQPRMAPTAQAAPAAEPAAPAPRAAAAPPREGGDQPAAANAVADRWAPMNQVTPTTTTPASPAAPPPSAMTPSAPSETAPAALATPETDVEEVAEGSVPAIQGPAPLPRRKPTLAASSRRSDPPLPRPRPDGGAPQSVWIAVPTTDDRYPGQ